MPIPSPPETERLVLRPFTAEDAGFALAMFNDPAFLQFIGDRHVRTAEEAKEYIASRFLGYYDGSGMGPWLVELKQSGEAVGFCTLFRRDWLNAVDLGFAFLPAHRSRGYAREAAEAMMAWARDRIGLEQLVAIVSKGNEASVRLLTRLGFRRESDVSPPDGSGEVMLFMTEL